MPSLAFVLFALAAFARSALAVDAENNTHELVKRRVNHADEYGYPHNRGPHVNNGKPMTPGGFVDPHPSNVGAVCKSSRDCHYMQPLALGYCKANKRCGWTCLGDSVKSGDSCVGQFKAPTCNRHKPCPRTSIKHATSVCYNKKCTFECDNGYQTQGNSCVKTDPNAKCGGKRAPEVHGGSAVCRRNRWVPVCNAQTGYKAYLIGGEYYCINTQTDANNCGKVGNKCPFAYNHGGRPFCRRGQCGVRN